MSFAVLPENLLLEILCLLDVEDRKCASLISWNWRTAFFRKSCIAECALVIESLNRCDRLSINLLKHVRHLRIKSPLSDVTFRRVVVPEFNFYEMLFGIVPFCNMLESIEFKKCEVEMSERRVQMSRYLKALEPAKRNLQKVKRITVTRLNILTDGFNLMLKACMQLESLQVDQQTSVNFGKVLANLGSHVQVLSLPADSDSWLSEIEQHAALADRGITLHDAYFNYVIVDEDAPDVDAIGQALHDVHTRHPAVALHVAFHVDHLVEAQEEFARLLAYMRASGMQLRGVTLAFTHRDEHGWQESRAIRQAVFDALPFDALDSLVLELANPQGALKKTLEQLTKSAASPRRRRSTVPYRGLPLKRLVADLTDDLLQSTSFLPRLRVLELTATPGWSRSFRLDVISRNCRVLERLKLLNPPDNLDACLIFSHASARARFERLKTLAIDSWFLEHRETFRISAPCLRKLELKLRASPCVNEKECRASSAVSGRHTATCRLADDALESRIWRQVVTGCSRLARIRTVCSPAQFVPLMQTISVLPQLRALDIECNYTDLFASPSAVHALAACHALRRVKLVHYSNVSVLRRIEADLPNLHFEVLPSFR